MSSDTYLTVTFRCSRNDDVAALARKHEPLLEGRRARGECQLYLRELGRRSGPNPGSNGGLSVWGYVGYAPFDVEWFIRDLMGFWSELLSCDIDGGPFYTEKIVIIYEEENRGKAQCFVLGYSSEAQDALHDHDQEKVRAPDPSQPGESVPVPEVHHHELPFSWMS